MKKKRQRRKQTSRPRIYIRKLRVVCICKKGNCEGFCNGIGNVDIRKTTVIKRKKRCSCNKNR